MSATNIKPIYGEDYAHHWPIEVKGKTVIDIGADYGSTAFYFMKKGALRVVCVEGNPALFKHLQANMRFLPNCVAVYKHLLSASDFADVLQYPAEIVKVDVEGAEKHLLNVDPTVLQQHYEWIMEIHRMVNQNQMIAYFQQAGFDVVHLSLIHI